MYPLIYIFVSEVKNRLFLLWREGAAAGTRPWCETAGCLSERCWHLVSGVILLPAEAAQAAAPSAHLVSAFGRLLSRHCLDGSSFCGSNRWTWCCCCPDAGRKHASECLTHVDFLSKWKRTSVTDNAGTAIATSCYFIISAVGDVKLGNKLISLYSQSVCGFGQFRPKTAHG